MLRAGKRLKLSPPCACASHRIRRPSNYARVMRQDDGPGSASKATRRIEEADYLSSLRIAARQKELERQRLRLQQGVDEDEIHDTIGFQAELASQILAEQDVTGPRRKLPRLLERAAFARRQAVETTSANQRLDLDDVFTKKGKEKILDAVERGIKEAGEDVRDGREPSKHGKSEEAGDHVRDIREPATQDKSEYRRNAVGVQLLSPSLHRQLFPGKPLAKPPKQLEKISLQHLKANDLSTTGAAVLPEISFDMPSLQGSNIRDHFHRLGQFAAEPYLAMAKEFASIDLPDMPSKWESSASGWFRYEPEGTAKQVQDLGDERLVCFDVETLYKLSPYPVMAIAATPTAWYSWLSPAVFGESSPSIPATLIPLGGSSPSTPRLVVGHNVGYDRARVLDEYHVDRSTNRWLDTLSLHVAAKGITSVQRPAWQRRRKEKDLHQQQRLEIDEYLKQLNRENVKEDVEEDDSSSQLLSDALRDVESTLDGGSDEAAQKRWEDVTSANSLREVARLHCDIRMDKQVRDTFGSVDITSATDLVPELGKLLDYCAKDVEVTHKVLKRVLPLFIESCPHPASFAGALGMGNPFLPVDKCWKEYVDRAERTYRELEGGVKAVLWELAYKLKRRGPLEGDPWTSQLDWTPKQARWSSDEVDVVDRRGTAPSELPDTPMSQPPADDKDSSASSTLPIAVEPCSDATLADQPAGPRWRNALVDSRWYTGSSLGNPLPLLLRTKCRGYPVLESTQHRWVFRVPRSEAATASDLGHGPELDFTDTKADSAFVESRDEFAYFSVGLVNKHGERTKVLNPLAKARKREWNNGVFTSSYPELAMKLVSVGSEPDVEMLRPLVEEAAASVLSPDSAVPWSFHLDWQDVAAKSKRKSAPKRAARKRPIISETWPKWFWELSAPESRLAKGELDLTVRKRIAPLLLRMQWKGFPLFWSKEHGWLFRADAQDAQGEPLTGLQVTFDEYKDGVDAALARDTAGSYYKLPHADGDVANVGNPLSRNFLRYVDAGTLRSAPPASGIEDDGTAAAAADAMNMNSQCSYWVSARERILGQMAVYQDDGADMGIPSTSVEDVHGMILPQVITMGTVTRRAVEVTWLTASNAKKNRVGSELKAMIRAPPGYAIVGADVDSEELWIASVMGDAQFGMHGATAIGWMTLEGTKSAGTDLHSKTAKILGTSRDAAKVFNYSRIYGAGVRHAVQLLKQNDAKLSHEEATKRAQDLYLATKGRKAWLPRSHQGKPSKDGSPRRGGGGGTPHIWHGGSETYLFNTLEGIAGRRIPRTPALGCGVTDALKKKYLPNDGVFGSDYLPSRINWVVQSSGVDYLHLLIVSMEYLIARYGISARYMISVHDEVRYMVREEDKYRAAMALQVANAWTRALFCYNIGMDDLPQGVAFFSAVDVDHVFRKEVDMACVTPSQPTPIPQGESVDIAQLLVKTDGGQLGVERDLAWPSCSASPVAEAADASMPPLFDLKARSHVDFLNAQASRSSSEAVRYLIDQAARERGEGGDRSDSAVLKGKRGRSR